REPDYLIALGRTLRAVHDVEARGAGMIDCDALDEAWPTGVHERWPTYIDVRLEDHIRFCVDTDYIGNAMADRINQLFDVMRPALADRPLRLLHGDLGTHNVCVDRATRSITAVIDWEDGLAGDPLFDLAMTMSFQPARRLAGILSGYGLSEPSLDER